MNSLGRLDELFNRALELEPGERESFIAEETTDTPDLRRELMALLASHEQAFEYFDDLAEEVAVSVHAELRGAAYEGREIGPYRIVRQLGHGGMGRVFLAERSDGQFEQQVALKLIRRGVDVPLVRERFLAERRILSGLQHPNIARLLDGGFTEDGRPFAALEFVDGAPLTEHVRKLCLSLRERLELFLQVADAVEYAHRNLVVHRDLKPSNILVDHRNDAKLLDFGIAKLLDEEAGQTRTGVRMLTPEYAAPEQIAEGPITTGVDVYSLGTILFELVAGQRAFDAGDEGQHHLEQLVLDQDPDPPSRVLRRRDPAASRRVRGDLDTICLRAMRKEPSRRYASVAELAQDVRLHLDGRPIRAHAPSAGYRLRKFVRRHALGVGIATTAAVLLLAAGGLFVHQSLEVRAERDRADRVTELFVDMFRVADRSATNGAELRARDVLDAGVTQIVDQLDGQPDVKASLLEMAGRVYHNLGLYDDARPLYEATIDLRQGGADANALATSLERFGRLQHDDGDYEGSLTTLRAALSRSQSATGDRSPSTARVQTSLGLTLLALADHDSARASFVAARDILTGTDERADLADAIAGVAMVDYSIGAYADAEALLLRALDLRDGLGSSADLLVAETLNNLGSAQSRQGKFPEALGSFGRSLEIRRQILGPDHPNIATGLNNIALAHLQSGNPAAAEPLLRESVAMRRRVLTAGHPDLAQSLGNLGLLLARSGRLEEATAAQVEALSIRRGAFGSGHPLVATSLNNVGLLYRLAGDYVAAETSLREARAILLEALGTDHPNTAVAHNDLATLLDEVGRDDEAEVLYREALAVRRRSLPPDHVHIAYGLVGLGNLLVETRRHAEAIEVLEEALSIRTAAFGEGHPQVEEVETALIAARRGGADSS